MGVQISVWVLAFNSFGWIPQSRIVRTKGNSMSHFLKAHHTILHPRQQCTRVSSFSTSPPTLTVFWVTAILMDVKWYLIVVLICISITISDVYHLFECLTTICISSFEKSLFSYFAHFLIELFVLLLLSCKSSYGY